MLSSKSTHSQVSQFILENPLWSLKDNKLHREFIFSNFIVAFGFMSQIALIAESLNHHPEWFNVYNKVRVNLTTHEFEGISTKDFRLAKAMDAIANRLM